jgi:hypothetical protein
VGGPPFGESEIEACPRHRQGIANIAISVNFKQILITGAVLLLGNKFEALRPQ